MLYTYLKIAIRQLGKHRLFTGIKLLSLAIGLTACLLIGLYIQHESSFDNFHENSDQIYRAVMQYSFQGEEDAVEVTGNKVVPALVENVAGLKKGTRVIKYENVVRHQDLQFEESNIYFADSTFFNIFSFPLLGKNRDKVLTEPNQVILSESKVTLYFGSSDPLGKLIEIGSDEYEVVGVMSQVPENSQLQPDFVASFYSLRDAAPERETWWNANYASYFLANEMQTLPVLQSRVDSYMGQTQGEAGLEKPNYLTYELEPLTSVHLHSDVPGNFIPNGDLRYLKILSLIALLILLIACSIYINLTNALGSERAREVGVQKVLGASRQQLFVQHMGESMVLTAIAMIVALITLVLVIPYFNAFFSTSISTSALLKPALIISWVLLWLLISLVAGGYPTQLITRVHATQVLKGRYRLSIGSLLFRKGLIVFQFAIAMGLIISTLVLNSQLHYIQTKNLGLDTDQVVVLPADRQVIDKLPSIKSQITQNPGIHSASLVYETPSQIDGTYSASPTEDQESELVQALPVDEDFIVTMDIGLASGTNFTRTDITRSRDYLSDSTAIRKILINSTFSRDYGWGPQEAVGKIINFNGSRSQIQGVTKDFHFSSLHENIRPLVLFPDTWGNQILVKLAGANIREQLAQLEALWAGTILHRPFTFHFLDEEYDQMYQSEMRTATLVSIFSSLAILLACMGLFGLTSILIARRTKEIGVRKVLGSSTIGIVKLLSKNFVLLIALSFLLICPVVYWLMQNWLDNFHFRIDIPYGAFAIAGISVLVFSLAILVAQGIKATLQNPINSLRSE